MELFFEASENEIKNLPKLLGRTKKKKSIYRQTHKIKEKNPQLST